MVNLLNLFSVLLFLVIPASSHPNQQLLYAGFKDMSTNNLTMNKGAEIEKNGILKFTNETRRSTGYAFYPTPFQFKNSSNGKVSSFASSFALAIVSMYPKIGGHDLAFTIATTSDIRNSSNHLFAVEFDTFKDFYYVGIDIKNLESNASANKGDYIYTNITTQDLDIKSGIPILAWVDYDSAENVITVSLARSSSKPKTPFLSYHVDLSPIFFESMYVGFSASTDLLASSRYVLGWSFKINGPAPPLDLSSLPQLPGPKKGAALIAAVSVTVVVIAWFVFLIGIYLFWKVKNADVVEDWEREIGPHRYSYQELQKATNGFKDKELLGQGGFGKVYKGTLPNSETQVAVKRISNESNQGLMEFVSEIASIGRLRHRNLVQLLGWCRRRSDLLLVYDFMANGSLDKYLFGEPEIVLSWEQRIKIIKDVASALLYLHEGYEQVVIHRDVKAGNVLLDSQFNGRLGDFGLARLYEHGANPSTTRVVGTFGYLAPELHRTGKATPSSDVFAFGALLVEVACGLRPIEAKKLPEDIVLVDWVWKRYKEGRILDVVDPKLNGDFDEKEALLVLKLGLMCSNGAPSARPSMRQVVRFLNGEIGFPDELRKPREIGHEEGFDGFLHSLESSSFDKMSPSSCIGNRHMHASFPYFVTSPLFTANGRGETW